MLTRRCGNCGAFMHHDAYHTDCSTCRQDVTSDLASGQKGQSQESQPQENQSQEEYCPVWLFPGILAVIMLFAWTYCFFCKNVQALR